MIKSTHYIQKLASFFHKGIDVYNRYGMSAVVSILRHKKKERIQQYHYQKWITIHEPTSEIIQKQKKDADEFQYRPKISIITPVWNVDEKWLRLCIESVISQTYVNWELCLVDGNSSKPHIQRVLKEYESKDHRIKIKILQENKGIAGNSQEAIDLATGDFIGLLDHDDELAPFALFEVVKVLNENRSIMYLYSDEDKIDCMGRRKLPFFKPDWSPDLLLSVNYLCHFSVIQRELLLSVGCFHKGYDGSQDYDLFLRVTERLQAKQIWHIPEILYHWRIIPESASSSITAKPYAYTSGKRAIEDSLERRNILVEDVTDGTTIESYRVHYNIPSESLITIIVHGAKNQKNLSRCIHSILEKTTYHHYQIYVICDDDEYNCDTKYHDEYSGIKNPNIFFYQKDLEQYSSSINSVISRIHSPFFVLLNGNTEIISEDWLTAMVEHAQFDDVGVVGGLLLYPDNTIEQAGLIIGSSEITVHSHQGWPYVLGGYCSLAAMIHNVSAVSADCMMMRTDLFKEIGGFDPILSNLYYDVDLCLRLSEGGFRNISTPYSQLYHHVSTRYTYGRDQNNNLLYHNEYEIMYERWKNILIMGDPYYNKNLNPDKGFFSIKLS